jgi:hypothetical protein
MLSRSRLNPPRLLLPPSPRSPHRKLKSLPSTLKLRLTPAWRQQARRVFRRVARQATRTPRRQPLPCPPAAWSCPKPGPAQSTKRPTRLKPHPPQAPGIKPQAFNAASRSSTVGLPEAPALIHNGLREALQDSTRPERARVPSILPAPRREAMPDLVALPFLAPVPVLAHGPALERPVQAASEVRPAPEALRPPARRLVRSERRPAEAAADARSIPRPKKAR